MEMTLPLDVWEKTQAATYSTCELVEASDKPYPSVRTALVNGKLMFSSGASFCGIRCEMYGKALVPAEIWTGDITPCYKDVVGEGNGFVGFGVSVRGKKMVVSESVSVKASLPNPSCGVTLQEATDWCNQNGNFGHWWHTLLQQGHRPAVRAAGPFSIVKLGNVESLLWKLDKSIQISQIPDSFDLGDLFAQPAVDQYGQLSLF